MKLQGKNVILTGASRGFGKYLAERLWEEGANLFLTARHNFLVNYPDREQTCNVSVHDLADDESAGTLMYYALKFFGERIDGLINNAAIQGPVGEVWQTNWEAWHETMQVNLMSPIDLCRLAVPRMLNQNHSKIVNLSGGGATNPRPNYSAYATAKAGLIRFSECLAEELKGTGIDVNCVSPGKMPTGMLPPGEVALEQTMVEAADLIIFLLSDESNGITGRLISAVWDNWRDLPNKKAELEFSHLYTLRRIGEDDEPGRSYYQHLKETGQIK